MKVQKKTKTSLGHLQIKEQTKCVEGEYTYTSLRSTVIERFDHFHLGNW